MVMSHGLLRDAEEALMRITNQDVPRGHARPSCGHFKSCGFMMTLCAAPTTLALLLEPKETKTHHTNKGKLYLRL